MISLTLINLVGQSTRWYVWSHDCATTSQSRDLETPPRRLHPEPPIFGARAMAYYGAVALRSFATWPLSDTKSTIMVLVRHRVIFRSSLKLGAVISNWLRIGPFSSLVHSTCFRMRLSGCIASDFDPDFINAPQMVQRDRLGRVTASCHFWQ